MAILDDAIATLAQLDAAIRGAEFQNTCDAFFGQYSSEFKGVKLADENKLEWTEIHKKYEVLVEAQLEKAVSEESLASLCGQLQEVLAAESAEQYNEAVMLLTSFSDFLSFKQMMIARANQGEKSVFAGTIKDLSTNEDLAAMADKPGINHLDKILQDSAEMYQISQVDGWQKVISKDSYECTSLKGQVEKSTGKKVNYMKFVVLVDMPVKDHLKLWCDAGPDRNEWDKGIYLANSKVVKDYSETKTDEDYNTLVEATLSCVPKLMRWAMRIPDPFQMRVVTQRLGDGCTAYATVGWDAAKDQPDTKFEYSETGVVKAHPSDATKSYLVSVSKVGSWTPMWVIGKFSEGFFSKTMPALVQSYKKVTGLK